MNRNKILMASLALTAASVTMSSVNAEGPVKCFGIAKAGQNSCKIDTYAKLGIAAASCAGSLKSSNAGQNVDYFPGAYTIVATEKECADKNGLLEAAAKAVLADHDKVLAHMKSMSDKEAAASKATTKAGLDLNSAAFFAAAETKKPAVTDPNAPKDPKADDADVSKDPKAAPSTTKAGLDFSSVNFFAAADAAKKPVVTDPNAPKDPNAKEEDADKAAPTTKAGLDFNSVNFFAAADAAKKPVVTDPNAPKDPNAKEEDADKAAPTTKAGLDFNSVNFFAAANAKKKPEAAEEAPEDEEGTPPSEDEESDS